MSASQRTKGAAFEREVCHALTVALGQVVTRKLGQARDGGDDIQVGRYRIECKRRGAIAVYPWLAQAQASAAPTDIPLVVARGDGQEALVIPRLADFLPLMASGVMP